VTEAPDNIAILAFRAPGASLGSLGRMSYDDLGALVFHHPAPLSHDPQSGSSLRPLRMAQAFEEIGIETVHVTGYSAERAGRARVVIDQLRAGRRFVGVYGESVTMPTALSDPWHLPVRPMLDARFYRSMNRTSVPTGLFYRDAYWRFPFYGRALRWPKRAAAIVAYRYDLHWYRRYVDVMFVQTRELIELLPHGDRFPVVVELPPGGDRVDSVVRRPVAGTLNIMYVGGVAPPVYDLTPILAAVDEVASTSLVVCCRPAESTWVTDSPLYHDERVEVVHRGAEQLRELYQTADVTVAGFGASDYMSVVTPVKVFEAIAHGVPIVISRDCAAARLIEDEHIGWIVDDAAGLAKLLARLRDNPSELMEKAVRLNAVRDRHTWAVRARKVVDELTAVDRRSTLR